MRRLVLLLAFLIAPSLRATTYYISNGIGADTNTSVQAQNKTTPWAHAPGMANCASNCATYTPVGGDSFIFRGGDTWTSTSFPWNWSWSGTSTNCVANGNANPTNITSCIYIGVDQTWFTGGSWTRPIMSCSLTCASQLTFSNVSYFIVDNLEWTGLFSSSGTGGGGTAAVTNAISTANIVNVTATVWVISNNYFHGSCIRTDSQSAGYLVLNDNAPSPASNFPSTYVTFNVFDGTDQQLYNGTSCGAMLVGPQGCGSTASTQFSTMDAIFGVATYVYGNYFTTMSNFMRLDDYLAVHDNLMEKLGQSTNDISPSCNVHENGLWTINTLTNSSAYNNIVRNMNEGGAIQFGVAPLPSTDVYLFNNLAFNNLSGNGSWGCGTAATPGGTCHFFNNTQLCSLYGQTPQPCGTGGTAGANSTNTFNINEHVICDPAAGNCGASNAFISCPNSGSCHYTTNTQESESSATSQGYTHTQTYPYSPSLASNPTVGAGTNETSMCTTISGFDTVAGAACQKDFDGGIIYNSSNHTVSLVNRPVNTRPSSGAWDAGAYQFVGSQPAPAPPTFLVAIVR